jgi:ArsR family transcriptional regulator
VSSVVESLRLISEPTRLRLLLLLDRAELTVAELQEILSMKQSRISTQLGLLKNAGLVRARRSGKNSLYSMEPAAGTFRELIRSSAPEIAEAREDRRALDLALRKRSDHARAYFDQLAGKFGRSYCPGRSWKGLAEALLLLMPRQTIADLGAGEGTFSQLLAQRAERVIAIDSSEKMVEYGMQVAREIWRMCPLRMAGSIWRFSVRPCIMRCGRTRPCGRRTGLPGPGVGLWCSTCCGMISSRRAKCMRMSG